MQNIRIKNSHKQNNIFSYKQIMFIFAIMLCVALAYLWSHVHTRQLEYKLATEISKKEQLKEEQNRLKVEYDSLRSPKRIEEIAIKELKMRYPKRGQVLSLP